MVYARARASVARAGPIQYMSTPFVAVISPEARENVQLFVAIGLCVFFAAIIVRLIGFLFNFWPLPDERMRKPFYTFVGGILTTVVGFFGYLMTEGTPEDLIKRDPKAKAAVAAIVKVEVEKAELAKDREKDTAVTRAVNLTRQPLENRIAELTQKIEGLSPDAAAALELREKNKALQFEITQLVKEKEDLRVGFEDIGRRFVVLQNKNSELDATLVRVQTETQRQIAALRTQLADAMHRPSKPEAIEFMIKRSIQLRQFPKPPAAFDQARLRTLADRAKIATKDVIGVADLTAPIGGPAGLLFTPETIYLVGKSETTSIACDQASALYPRSIEVGAVVLGFNRRIVTAGSDTKAIDLVVLFTELGRAVAELEPAMPPPPSQQ